jgi:hypothetical protein
MLLDWIKPTFRRSMKFPSSELKTNYRQEIAMKKKASIYFFSESSIYFAELHGVISQKMSLLLWIPQVIVLHIVYKCYFELCWTSGFVNPQSQANWFYFCLQEPRIREEPYSVELHGRVTVRPQQLIMLIITKLLVSVKVHGSSATFQQCWKRTTLTVNNNSVPDSINNFQNYWVIGFCLSSGTIKTREHKISETATVSVFRWGGTQFP